MPISKWSTKPKDRVAAAFGIPGFYRIIDGRRHFDFDVLTRDPGCCRFIAGLIEEKLCEVIRGRAVQFLSFLEKRDGNIGLVTLAGALTLRTGIPNLIIQFNGDNISASRIKFAKEAGDQPLESYKIILITDYVKNDEELSSTIRAIKDKGGTLAGLIILIAEETFSAEGLGVSSDLLRCVWRAEEAERIAIEDQKIIRRVFGN